MKTLLTGFVPFGKIEINPSQLIVEQLAREVSTLTDMDLITEVLPTEFTAAGERIAHLIHWHRPERIICLGVARGSKTIRFERVALNLDDAEEPDNAGLMHDGKRIVADGPAAYWSTLPIEAMRDDLRQRGIPASVSNHAGTFVCNHVFYLARHEVERMSLGSPCGFIHLPQVPDLPLDTMREAVSYCLCFPVA